MFIHKFTCISPQHTFPQVNLEDLVTSDDNKLSVIEPKYANIPLNILRRMGKAVRIGVGAAIPLIEAYPKLNGIIIGTANGGMEDCIKFLNQVMQYDEESLTPTNFVQSTTNAIAAQIGLSSKIHGYNITHVHRGLAFENCLLDIMMLLRENPDNTYLAGGVDEISTYNHNIQKLTGLYKDKLISSKDLYVGMTTGSIVGEGVAMFVINNSGEGSIARISALKTLKTDDPVEVATQMKNFLCEYLSDNNQIDLFLIGENGDSRQIHFYDACEAILNNNVPVGRFKHLCGEYPTSGSFALWLACHILEVQHVPKHVYKKYFFKNSFEKIIIYNNYRGEQHSFLIVERTLPA